MCREGKAPPSAFIYFILRMIWLYNKHAEAKFSASAFKVDFGKETNRTLGWKLRQTECHDNCSWVKCQFSYRNYPKKKRQQYSIFFFRNCIFNSNKYFELWKGWAAGAGIKTGLKCILEFCKISALCSEQMTPISYFWCKPKRTEHLQNKQCGW